MGKIAVVYASVHHQNTEKLLQGIRASCPIDLFRVSEAEAVNWSMYEAVGIASGIYAGKLHRSVEQFLEQHSELPKKAFVICTSGMGKGKYAGKYEKKLRERGFSVLGGFECKGFDTFAFLKWFGGIRKGHPDQQDIDQGTKFVQQVLDGLDP